jgi:hypothetical protein
MSAQDVDTIRTAYEEFAEHDAAAVLAKLDSRVEWVEGGGGDSPSGTFIGPDAVASGVFAVIGANFDEYHVDPSEYIDQGSRVVVKGHFSGKNKGGAVLDTGFEHVFDMRDGKVVRFENKPADAEAWIAGWTSRPSQPDRGPVESGRATGVRNPTKSREGARLTTCARKAHESWPMRAPPARKESAAVQAMFATRRSAL